ncbi:hypothetical protein MQE23_04295 [Streptomyces sp. HP-A2021]|uniref:hypothetical protein n=1 Tax=Streptomyces sp. HP-A2021 TaxID=2927875 RepID=UPI001FAF1C6B|nr:hypothetical protein [Streptomyces sp. HP-A2021]UOB08323.1 hypothetical protein MQE23_04295 [Streptomyces sp. HP-A2021]
MDDAAVLDPVEAVVQLLKDPVDLEGDARDPVLGGPLAGRLPVEADLVVRDADVLGIQLQGLLHPEQFFTGSR